MSNNLLYVARMNKRDEFYTKMETIESEMIHHEGFFRGKRVYCNCDDPSFSQFWRYFHLNFDKLQLKSLTATYIVKDDSEFSWKYVYLGGKDQDVGYASLVEPLSGNGDFRSDECIDILKQSDVVVTNPPFSLWLEFTSLLDSLDVKFLILGNLNALATQPIAPILFSKRIWLGKSVHAGDIDFQIPDEYEAITENSDVINGKTYVGVTGVRWFMNFDYDVCHEGLSRDLTEVFEDGKYRKYDKWDAINVDKSKLIPKDYNGVIGVPLTYIDRFDIKEWELVTFVDLGDGKPVAKSKDELSLISSQGFRYATACQGMLVRDEGSIDGKSKYVRLLIRRTNRQNA